MNKMSEMKKKNEVLCMLNEGWCFDCSGHFQLCLREGKCQGHSDVRLEEVNINVIEGTV